MDGSNSRVVLEECAGCSGKIHREDQVSAVFTADGKKSFFHHDCELKVDHFARWKEETPWNFKPTRMTVTEWGQCGPRKHLGIWQSMFVARRDEDVWCPDCGLKIARQDNITCPQCNGPSIIALAEPTKMVFTHGEPLYKLHLYCTERGDTASAYAVISGFTPVTLTSKKKTVQQDTSTKSVMMLKYQPKGDPSQGLKV